jgi:hypothetical protein
MRSSLKDYKCPLSIEDLYKMFYSLSYDARVALESMIKYYARNSSKDSIFVLEPKNQSFYRYANEVASETPLIANWILEN